MWNKFAIVILMIVAFPSPRYADPGSIAVVKKLLIDTDGGGDDTLALITALEAERLDNGPKIIGVTCVNGNIDVDQVALNVLKTLKVIGRLDVPVYKGAAHPLLLPITRDYYFGKDGLGDFYFPDPPSAELIKSEHAVNFMIDLVKQQPGEVTLLALGPLTNVALAIRMYPPFLNDLQQLVIMGGSTEGRGNSRPGIEFNFFADPFAIYVVFSSSISKPLTLVPYETTKRVHLTAEEIESLSAINNTKTWFERQTCSSDPDETPENWFWPDVVAATVAFTSGSVINESEFYYSEAIYDGKQTSGMIVVDYTNITGNQANTNLVRNLNRDIFINLFLRYISS